MGQTDSVENELRNLAGEIAQAEGAELYDLVLRRSGPRWKVLVYLTHPAGNVSLDQCASVSRQFSRELDVRDPIPKTYDLEVSSPGLERPLRLPSHWEAVIGQTVKVRFRDGENGTVQNIVATLDRFEGDEAVLTAHTADDEATFRVPRSEVLSARVHVDW